MNLKNSTIEPSAEVKLCLDFLNRARTLHDRFPLNRFLFCNSWENADFPSAFPLYVFLKYKKPVANVPITTDGKNSIISFGRIYTLLTGGILFGYLFELPKIKINLTENGLVAFNSTYDKQDLGHVEQLYHNSVFTVFKNAESLLITLNRHNYIKFKNKRVKDKTSEE